MPNVDVPRSTSIIGAPTNVGIRTFDDGTARGLDRAAGVLRQLGLPDRLGAADLGDVVAPPYRDFFRPAGGIRNEREVVQYSHRLAERVEASVANGAFTVVLGGDCSIVLGCLLGARRAAGPCGLAYLDAHADFGIPEESLTGSAASMCLGFAVGRGESPLAALGGAESLVRGEDVVLIGRRDSGQANYGHAALARSGILDLPASTLEADGSAAVATATLDRVARPDRAGFWIHLDADLIDPRVMPAVDSPEPGGPGIEELGALLGPLAAHPSALGLDLTIYDPTLDDADFSCARRLVDLLGSLTSQP